MTWKGFPNPARVRIALAEKGAADAFEFVPIDVFGGEHRTKAFRFKKPDASVPCLELADRSFISQSTAIIEYIDGSFEGESLTGKSPKERAQISMMNLRVESGLMNAVGAYFHHAPRDWVQSYKRINALTWATSKSRWLAEQWSILMKSWPLMTLWLEIAFRWLKSLFFRVDLC